MAALVAAGVVLPVGQVAPAVADDPWPAFNRELIPQFMAEDEVRVVDAQGAVQPIVHHIDVGIRTIKPANWDTMTPEEQTAHATWLSREKVQGYLDEAAAYWTLKVGTEIRFPIKQFRLYPVATCTSTSWDEMTDMERHELDGGYDSDYEVRRSAPGNVAVTIGGPGACISGAAASQGARAGLFSSGYIQIHSVDRGGWGDNDHFPEAMAHEMGHVFGLGHASAPYDANPSRQLCPPAFMDGPFRSNMEGPEAREGGDFCLTWEYQDYLDIMGLSSAPTLNDNRLSGVELAKLGALDTPNAVRTVMTPGSGTFTLIDQTVAGRSGLRVILARGTGDGSGNYAIEMGPTRPGGPVGVRIQRWDVGAGNTILLNAKNGVDNVLEPGDSFVSRDRRLKVTVIDVGATTATVQIDYGQPFAAVGQVDLSGQAVEGSPVRAVVSGWSPAPQTTTYQWLRGGLPISGATSATYTPTPSDVGAELSVRATVEAPDYRPEQVTSEPAVVAPRASAAIALSPARLVVGSNSGVYTVAVEANRPWEVVAGYPSWLVPQQQRGDAGPAELPFSVAANSSSTARSATVTIRTADGATTSQIVVEQARANPSGATCRVEATPSNAQGWSAASSLWTAPPAGGSLNLRVTTNQGSWNADAGGASTWLGISTQGTTLSVTAQPQATGAVASRYDTVVVRCGSNASTVVRVTQSPEPRLVLSADIVEAPWQGQVDRVEVESNGPWSVGALPAWIRATPANETWQDGLLEVAVDSNPSSEPRTATFEVSSQGLAKHVTVNQAGRPQPTCEATPTNASTRVEFDASTKTLALFDYTAPARIAELDISSDDGVWAIETDADWLQISNPSHMPNQLPSVSVRNRFAPPAETTSRTAELVIHCGEISTQFTIIQALPVTVNPSSLSVNATAQTQTVTVSSRNVSWYFSGIPRWMSAVPAEGGPGTTEVTLTFAANSGQWARSVNLYVSGGTLDVEQTGAVINFDSLSVSGTPQVGSELRAEASVDPPDATLTYRWEVDGTAIPG
ncbi:MAG: hypothetical protein LBH48_00755, partial [Bifidobacteriaceae bacterium]|nr:hypothetical protein [Bifidobacteriaceae bacterium]